MRGVKAASLALALTLVSGAIQLRLSIRRPIAAMMLPTSCRIAALDSGGNHLAT